MRWLRIDVLIVAGRCCEHTGMPRRLDPVLVVDRVFVQPHPHENVVLPGRASALQNDVGRVLAGAGSIPRDRPLLIVRHQRGVRR